MLVQKENVQLDIKPEELERYQAKGFKKVELKKFLEDVLSPKLDESKNNLDNEIDSDLEDVLNPKTKKNK